VVPGFVIQGGDPTGTGWGGPGYEITSEFSPLEYNRGIVGMASAGKDTEGSQWFVTTGNYPHLNGRYTIFAEVLKGMDVVEKIKQDDKILSVNLLRRN
jgi:cyclophilin family peptidyl-prolyl cis-trans isomerase